MQLRRTFHNLRFPEIVIRKAVTLMESMPRSEKHAEFKTLEISVGEETWDFDNVEDFFARFSSSQAGSITYDLPLLSEHWRCILSYRWGSYGSIVNVNAEHSHQVHSVMNVFKESISLAAPIGPEIKGEDESEPDFNIFIGHGRSKSWEELRNHLQDKHGYKVICFESGARAGHQIRDILDEMLDRSSLAFLVLTGEDETGEHVMRARQNVIHETGLFQGRLGFSRAIVLLEDGVEKFSNLAGIQYIPFAKDHINGTFGEVVAVIRRELGVPVIPYFRPIKLRGLGPSASEIIQQGRERF